MTKKLSVAERVITLVRERGERTIIDKTEKEGIVISFDDLCWIEKKFKKWQ